MYSEDQKQEKELIKRLTKGCRISYRHLYSKHLFSLKQFILPFAGNDPLRADEVVQDVFVKIWEERTKLTHIRSFQAYVFRMAKNRLYDLHKQRQARNAMLSRMDMNNQSTSAHEIMVFGEYLESAKAIVEELTPQRKRIFLMRTETEMSIAEIATALKISKSAVKKQLYESIHMVKSRLGKEHDWPLMCWIGFSILVVLW